MARIHTIGDIIEQAFPDGYLNYRRYRSMLGKPEAVPSKILKTGKPSFSSPPCSAVDLFAIAGYLLLKSGAYHQVSPAVDAAGPTQSLHVTGEMRAEWKAVGEKWRGDGGGDLPAPPIQIVRYWKSLMSFADKAVYRPVGRSHLTNAWWADALALFCIADEAALNIGFQGHGVPSAQAEFVEMPLRTQQSASGGGFKKGPSTFSIDANPDVLAVLPKTRTANVGCTLRSLSHNLALLPGRGQAQAHWSFTSEEEAPPPQGDPAPFNLVILPMPFVVQAKAFRAFPAESSKWGWFDVEPHWCPRSEPSGPPEGTEHFLAFVDTLLDEAARDCGTVHALVLPEVALSAKVFRALCNHLENRKGFELLISGLFDAMTNFGKEVRSGNFTAMARFGTPTRTASFDYAVREKHHRWRIDRSQIETYALGSALAVNRGWWEHIDIRSRSLDVFVVRGNATVTTLICEDLARNDPCQELVRGIGPNFVVALLMDGPQRKDRWPARYATVLAEDPGSSVLSITSYGLIDRTNKTGAFPPANQIGLFRDDTGKATEIQLPKGAHGVCLTLQPTILTEHTLDGRPDKGDAQSWRLTGVQPVSLKEGGERAARILKGEWPN